MNITLENTRTEPLIATYLHEKGGRLGLPVSGTFELTARCNFNCPMCYVHLDKDEADLRGRELTAQEWISIAEQAVSAGMMFTLLTGGEPFLRKDFFEIYDSMKKMGLMISINTNGSLLRGDVLQRLLDNPPFRINISLYGGCRDTYINMCGNDSFDQVTEAIRCLKERGVDVRLNLSVTPYNKDDIESIYRIATDMGIHIKCNTYMYPPNRKGSNGEFECSRLSPAESAEYTTKWDELRLGHSEFIERSNNIINLCSVKEQECVTDLDEGVRCRAGRSSFWLTWDGVMLPCGMMTSPGIRPLRTGFDKAWEYIRDESKAFTLPEKCLRCPKRKICSICAAVCVTETGDIHDVPDYMCEYTDALIEQAKEKIQTERGE